MCASSITGISSRLYPFPAYEFGGGSIIYGSMSLHYIQPETRSFGTTVVLPYKSGIKSEQNNYATY